jgi:hypothetical protein
MTPAAKEGLPAVVGELVARLECVALRVDPNNNKPIASNLLTFRELTDEIRAIATTLSALTAEAGKGEVPELPEPIVAYTYDSVRTIRDNYYTADQMREYARLALSTGAGKGEVAVLRDIRSAITQEPESCFGYSQVNHGSGIPRAYSVRENLLCLIDKHIERRLALSTATDKDEGT